MRYDCWCFVGENVRGDTFIRFNTDFRGSKCWLGYEGGGVYSGVMIYGGYM